MREFLKSPSPAGLDCKDYVTIDPRFFRPTEVTAGR